MKGDRVLLITTITGAIWAATMAAFAGGVSVWSAPDPWLWAWLFLVPISGVPLSLGLNALIARLQDLSIQARWLRLALPFLALVLIQATIDHWLFDLVRAWGGGSAGGAFIQGVMFNCIIYLWLFGFLALVYELLAATQTAARNARQALEAREAARTAQLEALRTELNPHMLFNTFNSLSSLVLAGRNDDAEAMIGRLSVYMRACLDGSEGGLIPLAEEIELIEAYLAVEAARFARTPDVRIDYPEDLADVGVPRLILQPLVENALKYAVHPSRGAAGVRITAAQDQDRLVLTVEDDGAAGRPVAAQGTGRGLSIVARRLETLFGDEASVTAAPQGHGFRVVLALPLRPPSLEAPRRLG